MSAARMPTVPVTAGPQDALRLVGVSKVYGSGLNGAATWVTALNEVSLAFPAGSFTAVMGPSGSGKSTLFPARHHRARRRQAHQQHLRQARPARRHRRTPPGPRRPRVPAERLARFACSLSWISRASTASSDPDQRTRIPGSPGPRELRGPPGCTVVSRSGSDGASGGDYFAVR
jgi:ATPase subunit of ABC transporter with duplicated ATPase domains